MLVVSGLSLNALTAGIFIAEDQRPAIGPPEHRFADDGKALPEGVPSRRDGIPRAAFEKVNPSCPPPVSSSQARIVASGGDTVVNVVVGGITYRQHRFTSDGTFTVSEAMPAARIEVLVVGGGGGGGKRHGGGGGAGGLVLATVPVSAGQSFDVVVGPGGDGGGHGRNPSAAKDGGNSLFGEGPLRLLAEGGGRGASFDSRDAGGDTAREGGSGGGARSVSSGTTNGASATQSSVTNRCSTLNEGHPGGAASGRWPGGGGGGAGGPGGAGEGTAAEPGTTQEGGIGLDLSNRFGTGVGDGGWFAGGGGGAPAGHGTRAGGMGGGGQGSGADDAGGPGTDGTGGGGGGARSENADVEVTGGRGGDGIVIVRYPLVPSAVRDVIAGEGETTAVIRWRVPEINAPTELDSYRIEWRAVSETDWKPVDPDVGPAVVFSESGSDADRIITAALDGISSDARHEFRISPLGSADGPSAIVGPSTVVATVAKGGDAVTLVGDDVVHGFTSPGETSFQLSEARSLRYLVVGGGGGGGSRHGGGGGAGGVVTNAGEPHGLQVPAGPYSLTVGAGGVGAPEGTSSIGSKGEDSSAFEMTAFEMTAFGGGAGSSLGTFDARQNGGSGGGARGNFAYSGGSGTPGQGFAGGAVPSTGGQMRGGGGGGAAAEGAPGRDGTGDGGAGRDLSATFGTTFGVNGVFGGGGGGSGDSADSADGGVQSIGGAGGGGRGGHGSSSLGEPGVDGSGGGGGGGGHAGSTNYEGHQGGSGTVIVRYAFLDSGVQAGLFAATATSAVLRWEEPSEGSETITGYRVERRGPPDPAWWGATVVTPTPGTTVHTLELNGLTENADRRFRVTALHGDRTGSVTDLVAVGRGGSSVRLVGTDVVHEFTAVGESSFVLGAPRTVTYLVVAGGGGGGSRHGGGGGGGGMLAGSVAVSPGTHPVTVGAGGIGARRSSSDSSAGNGENSIVLGVTAIGGGAGFNPGGPSIGGSGGGSANAVAPGGGTEGQGNDGGTGRTGDGAWAGGGGGGRGGVGANSPANEVGGAGGAAASSDIRGTTEWFSGGGGGAGITSGGAGGGGGGVVVGGAGGFSTNATDGTGKHAPGVGGGGGAGSYDGGETDFEGGDGGSGIVVLRYAFAP